MGFFFFLVPTAVIVHTQYENNIHFTLGFFADQEITKLVEFLGRMFLQQNKKAKADRWQVNYLKQYLLVEGSSGKHIEASPQLLENKEGKQSSKFLSSLSLS